MFLTASNASNYKFFSCIQIHNCTLTTSRINFSNPRLRLRLDSNSFSMKMGKELNQSHYQPKRYYKNEYSKYSKYRFTKHSRSESDSKMDNCWQDLKDSNGDLYLSYISLLAIDKVTVDNSIKGKPLANINGS